MAIERHRWQDELIAQKGELARNYHQLRVQTSMITRAEVIALLAHDLGHKAIQITERVQQFADFCRKALRDKRSPDAVDSQAHELIAASNLIGHEIQQIRRIGFRADEDPVRFDLRVLLDEICSTMRQALDRANMDVDIQTPGQMLLHGPRGIFGQAIFNLMINSVDAQRAAAKQRKNVIHIHCRKETQGEKSRVILQFSDEGPGISFQVFPDIKDVFAIGSTSKAGGTGTGLPVSRSLLDKYFRAELVVTDRRPPLFQIVVPIGPHERTKQ